MRRYYFKSLVIIFRFLLCLFLLQLSSINEFANVLFSKSLDILHKFSSLILHYYTNYSIKVEISPQ